MLSENTASEMATMGSMPVAALRRPTIATMSVIMLMTSSRVDTMTIGRDTLAAIMVMLPFFHAWFVGSTIVAFRSTCSRLRPWLAYKSFSTSERKERLPSRDGSHVRR